ncbi:MAG: hypothetical protein IRY98_06755 [Alicyclobacillaceae bacterium]|nr:hypothetical protein [Alicyclobacillaceae bacterium]
MESSDYRDGAEDFDATPAGEGAAEKRHENSDPWHLWDRQHGPFCECIYCLGT